MRESAAAYSKKICKGKADSQIYAKDA